MRQKTDRTQAVAPPKLPEEPPLHIPAKGKMSFRVLHKVKRKVRFQILNLRRNILKVPESQSGVRGPSPKSRNLAKNSKLQ